MTNAALQNLACGLVRNFERKHNTSLDHAAMIKRFGFVAAKTIEAFLDGRILREKRADILAAVEALEGDDQDASAILILCAGDRHEKFGLGEEAIVLNDRLMSRLQNMERFLFRIGKLKDFHSWIEDGDRGRTQETETFHGEAQG